jgi:hypothetical protein
MLVGRATTGDSEQDGDIMHDILHHASNSVSVVFIVSGTKESQICFEYFIQANNREPSPQGAGCKYGCD